MKYDVKCSKCGKVVVLDLLGKGSEREWKIKRFNDYGLCEDCENSENLKELITLQEKSKTEGLPELFGSVKQMLWAEQIRTDMINATKSLIDKTRWVKLGFESLSEKEICELLLEKYVKEDVTLEDAQLQLTPLKEFYDEKVKKLNVITTETDSKWFINHRCDE